MIRAIVVDDEELSLAEIRTMLQATGLIDVVKTYCDPMEAVAEVASLKPQVAFVDIRMPGIDGITLVEKLMDIDPYIRAVFITAYDEYAVKAFELNALDYILKPVHSNRLAKMVKRLAATVHGQGNVSNDLSIRCFGGFEVKIGGESVKWERSKAEELFAYLLVHHGQGIHNETILEALWPDYNPGRAKAILQTSVYKVRSIFAPLQNTIKLEYAAKKYSLTAVNCICDLFFVEDTIKNYKVSGDISRLEKAGYLVSEGFMEGQGYLWAAGKEEQIKADLCSILNFQGESLYAAGKWSEAAQIIKPLLKLVPYNEDANNRLLHCYSNLDNGAGIIEHFLWLEKTLEEDYDLAPALSTQELYRQLLKEKYGK